MHQFRDLTLGELLADSLTQAVMTADRVDRAALEAMLRSIADEIADDAHDALRSARGPFGRLAHWAGEIRGLASHYVPCGSRDRSQLCGAP